MERPKYNIPSVIAHSCFIGSDGVDVQLSAKEIDYFYLLLYLSRNEILLQTPSILIKDGSGTTFNENVSVGPIKIECISFQNCGVVSNYQYSSLKSFFEKIAKLSIKTNILGKVGLSGVKVMRMIEQCDIESNIVTIKYTEEFLKTFFYVGVYFKEVGLNNLFRLGSGKAKLLYLVMKDYVINNENRGSNKKKCGARNVTTAQLQSLIGDIPQKSVFDGILRQIEECTDIRITYTTVGSKLKTYKFKVFPIEKHSEPKGPTVDDEVMAEAKKRMEKLKSKGVVINNEKGYLAKTCQNIIDERKPSVHELEIDEILIACKEEYDWALCENEEFPIVVFEHNDYPQPLFVDNEYRLTDRTGIRTTNSAEETLNFITRGYECQQMNHSYGYSDRYSEVYEKVCLLTPQQLKDRKLI